MSGVAVTMNINESGGCAACPPTCGNLQVRVKYRDGQSPDSIWKPVTAEGAEKLLVQFAARIDIAEATIEPLGV